MRVLIISHNPFSKINNNGKTLESIFQNFNNKELMQLYFVEDEDIDINFAGDYFKITDNDVLNKVIKFKDHIGQHEKNLKDNKGYDKSILLKLKNKKYLFSLFRDCLWKFSNVKNNEKLHDWIKRNNPDFIFFVGGNQIFSHEINMHISKMYNIPFAVFFTDDYVLFPIHKTFLDKVHHKFLKKAYNKTVLNASMCFCIGEKMSKEYNKHFKKSFLPIMNSVDINNSRLFDFPSQSEKIIISYFGGLHLNRWKMIVRIAKILANIDNVNIYVYSAALLNKNVKEQFEQNDIHFKGKVAGKDMVKELNKANILLHVESDDKYMRALTKLSVSTKIPEYLLSKRPILAYGPTEVASMELLSKNEIGIVVDSEKSDIDNLEKIKFALNNHALTKEYSEKGLSFALQNFDEEKISKNFRKIIESDNL